MPRVHTPSGGLQLAGEGVDHAPVTLYQAARDRPVASGVAPSVTRPVLRGQHRVEHLAVHASVDPRLTATVRRRDQLCGLPTQSGDELSVGDARFRQRRREQDSPHPQAAALEDFSSHRTETGDCETYEVPSFVQRDGAAARVHVGPGSGFSTDTANVCE